ncbi:hypothetical protein AvCA_52110 [Azotobacter vinelandii CA]|uniref:Uncharacterized protein n=2 Tax=Azotobacter vinelandii TaxID=354 RepID=C1DMK9_AZOVD|nr:hypothetical protein Avin_52110 [Azotobacter vinelandii DJ]AGK14112.1 hypothetical protein AvCA_52110 [Azotobacter vinelandii CA]AGK22457.1 hypothetical protein AvCA6_52110 [Azotobacter vinelandii CA6]
MAGVPVEAEENLQRKKISAKGNTPRRVPTGNHRPRPYSGACASTARFRGFAEPGRNDSSHGADSAPLPFQIHSRSSFSGQNCGERGYLCKYYLIFIYKKDIQQIRNNK